MEYNVTVEASNEIVISLTPTELNVVIDAIGPQGPAGVPVYIQPNAPTPPSGVYLWFQTGPNGMTLWIEDGE